MFSFFKKASSESSNKTPISTPQAPAQASSAPSLGTSPIETQILAVFRKIFGRPELNLHREMTAFDLQGWTSLMHIRLVVAIEQEFKIKFNASEVSSFRNVGNMIDSVQGKLSRSN